jgi:predicted RNA-binding Zn ribbon-like protein
MAQERTHTSRDDDRTFYFLGGALALDLANTEVMVRGQPRDLLQTPADLDEWWRRARVHHPTPELSWPDAPDGADGETLTQTKELRQALRHSFEAVARGEGVAPADLGPVNRVLSSGYRVLDVTTARTVRARWHSRDAGPARALLAVALSAVDLLTRKDLGRLHRCENARCVLLFYDATKSGTRRWCSTGCMDRARSLARYHQRKGASGP